LAHVSRFNAGALPEADVSRRAELATMAPSGPASAKAPVVASIETEPTPDAVRFTTLPFCATECGAYVALSTTIEVAICAGVPLLALMTERRKLPTPSTASSTTNGAPPPATTTIAPCGVGV
jgi:anaerobic selenocysteine-containing dehydrogenase